MANLVRLTIFDGPVRFAAAKLSTPKRREVAAEVAADARASAAVFTGAYRDGIGVEASGDDVHVVDDDEDAVYKEYGTSDTPAHAALTDAARQRGRYSGWQPKGRRR
ncbi:HK97 gp10 family phage protein [Nocardia wallacei]|uniref:HK97 gp10 family phage protein n=1 Tax=Nocardia wallacei TaxID=480035 RepID=UPI0024558B39|nr:HK97 gp10 family phage protein [Nocardia wallacei]